MKLVFNVFKWPAYHLPCLKHDNYISLHFECKIALFGLLICASHDCIDKTVKRVSAWWCSEPDVWDVCMCQVFRWVEHRDESEARGAVSGGEKPASSTVRGRGGVATAEIGTWTTHLHQYLEPTLLTTNRYTCTCTHTVTSSSSPPGATADDVERHVIRMVDVTNMSPYNVMKIHRAYHLFCP